MSGFCEFTSSLAVTMPIILALGRLRHDGAEYNGSVVYTVSSQPNSKRAVGIRKEGTRVVVAFSVPTF